MHKPYDQEQLERHLSDWRDSLSERISDPAIINELEDHLRSSFAVLYAEHQDLDAAWNAAVHGLGHAQQLSTEFSKLRPSRLDRNVLRAVLCIGALAGIGLMMLVAYRPQGQPSDLLRAGHIASISLGYVAALTLCGVGLFIASRRLTGARWYATGMHPVDARDLSRCLRFGCKLVTLGSGLGIVLGAIWSYGEHGRAWSWDLGETGALTVFVYYSALLLRRPSPRDETGGLAALGGALTLLAWFGGNMLVNAQFFPSGAFMLLASAVAICLGLALGTTLLVNPALGHKT